MQPDHDTIRARAYQIWEESGCGDGNHEEHWRRAEAECAAADDDGPDSPRQDGVVTRASGVDGDGATPAAESDRKLGRVPLPIGQA